MFNEKSKEYDTEQKIELPVWISPKYEESKKKALELISSKKYDLTEADFWILMNRTKNKDKMAYTGLIISHNGCLKINDKLEDEKKFKPAYLQRVVADYNNSLVYEYNSPEQGLYEVGEVSKQNCKNNDYPFAMAFKRLFDRVVLKMCKLAYAGIYSDSEADEFKEKIEETSHQIQTENKSTEIKGDLLGGIFVLSGGKHKGKTIQEVYDTDKSYCEWYVQNSKNENIRNQFQKCIEDNKKEIEV